MACDIRTVDGRTHDRFELEPVTPRLLKDSELCDVQLAVLEALPAPRRSRSRMKTEGCTSGVSAPEPG